VDMSEYYCSPALLKKNRGLALPRATVGSESFGCPGCLLSSAEAVLLSDSKKL
jgi:hypothetical protein